MCDFKPGDEIQVVKVGKQSSLFISVGQIHVVREVALQRDQYGNVAAWDDGETVGVKLVGIVARKPDSIHRDALFHPALFRKVQRRDLNAWLKISVGNTDRLDKRAPAKEGV